MKKLLSTLLLIILTTPVFSQQVIYNTDYFSIRVPHQTWERWEVSNIAVIIEYDNHKISVYSKYLQKYSFDDSESKPFKGGYLFTFYCTNDQSLHCIIELWSYDSGAMYMKVKYKNMEYKYRLRKGKMLSGFSIDSI